MIRSEYGADAENYAPAAFLGLEGVMGYMIMRYTVPTESQSRRVLHVRREDPRG